MHMQGICAYCYRIPYWLTHLITRVVHKGAYDGSVTFIVHSCLFTGQTVGCYDSWHRLANQSTYQDANGTQYNIGTLEVCINGTYYPSCLDSVPENVCSYIYFSHSGRLCTSSQQKGRWKNNLMHKTQIEVLFSQLNF